MSDDRKTRADAWGADLTDDQRWTVYERFQRLPWQEVSQWAAKEFNIETPSRAALYRFATRMRASESAWRIERAVAGKAAAEAEMDAIGDISPALKKAYALRAMEAELNGDHAGSKEWLQLACMMGDELRSRVELEIKAHAEQRQTANTALAREKMEVDACRRFLEWFKDARAREIAESGLSQADQIAAMRAEYFKDVDQLEKTGSVVLPQ